MTEELLCRHCHKRIHAAYSGATCPDCGAQLNGRAISRDLPKSRVVISVSSRRKAWAAFPPRRGVWVTFAILIAVIAQADSLLVYSASSGFGRALSEYGVLTSLVLIVTFLTIKVASAAAEITMRKAIIVGVASSALALLLSAISLLTAGDDFSVSYVSTFLFLPAAGLFSAVFTAVLIPRQKARFIGNKAMGYALAMFAVILIWGQQSFRYSDSSPRDWAFLRGLPVALLIFGVTVVSTIAIAKSAARSPSRVRACIGLGLGLLQAPVAGFIIWANVNIDDIDWYGIGGQVLGDCRNISTALLLFHNDTGTWPIYSSADHSPESRVDYLYGNMGDMPRFINKEVEESWGTRAEDAYFLLVTNGRNDPYYRYGRGVSWEERAAARKAGKEEPSTGGWDGPYLPYTTDDPWAFRYIISVSGFEGGTRPDNHVWCLSAGPNFIVETPAWATATHGDDIGYRTK